MKKQTKKQLLITAAFRKLVEEARPDIGQVFNLDGPSLAAEENTACGEDWNYALTRSLADVFEASRFDLSDPTINPVLRRRLARLVAICEAWNDQLDGE